MNTYPLKLFIISDYRRDFPTDDYNHNTPNQQTNLHQNASAKSEYTNGNTTIIENGGHLTPPITIKNGSISNDSDMKATFGTPLIDASSKFSANRSSRSRVADESQQFTNGTNSGLSLQGQRQAPLSVSVSASNSPFINKRMGSKQMLLQVNYQDYTWTILPN